MDDLTPYERDRQERIARNRAVLAALGLGAPAVTKRKAKVQSAPKKKKTKRERVGGAKREEEKEEEKEEEGREEAKGLRRSRRIAGKVAAHRPVQDHGLDDDNNEEEEEQEWRPPPSSKTSSRAASTPRSTTTEPRENVFGPIAGIEGYEDDIDLGDAFTYTGEGGRDLKGTKTNPKNLRTAPQSKDQTLTKGNMALYKSWETGLPVRVIRGFKSEYGPKSGYRYDGLYRVKKAWSEKGFSGFLVWKFALVRLPDQDPLPPKGSGDDDDEDDEDEEDEENHGWRERGEETEGLGGMRVESTVVKADEGKDGDDGTPRVEKEQGVEEPEMGLKVQKEGVNGRCGVMEE
ncbi:hypothetical protein HK104_006533 [Borealophlyctis nickersoniae]|nr:hypothetical protein HK104_006533 [Borealophlyctis nickersoniae]